MPYQKGPRQDRRHRPGRQRPRQHPRRAAGPGAEHRQAHRRHDRGGHQRGGLPRQRPAGRHDQQRLRLCLGPRRQDPGHALPRGRRHVPGLHRLPAVPGHPERPARPRHQALAPPASSPRRSSTPTTRPSTNPPSPWAPSWTRRRPRPRPPRRGITVKEDAGRGWRQVVASPIPRRIVEFDAVRDLVEDGYVVVSTGGGGVPVFETENGYVGTPAVIDKDLLQRPHGRRASAPTC